VFVVTVFVVVLLLQRNARVDGSALPLAMLTLPSILGMWVAFAGYSGAAGTLAAEREDGTLLRAKACRRAWSATSSAESCRSP
jgi:ABC-2 type transport system permease protein